MHPLLLYFRHAIPLANLQPKLAHTVYYYVGNVDCLKLRVRGYRDVRELKEFLDCGEHSFYRFARFLYRLLDDVLPFQELMQHQLTIVVL